jgi:hypothetical protein
MDPDTPIKILHPRHDCFICKKEIIDSKDKTKIFGKSKLDLPLLITRSTQINLDNYEDHIELAICCICYRLLLRYKNALEKLDTIESEIRKSFNRSTNVSVKRMSKGMECENPPAKKVLTFRDDGLDTRIETPGPAKTATLNAQSVPVTLQPVNEECTVLPIPPVEHQRQMTSTPNSLNIPQSTLEISPHSGNGDLAGKSKNVRIIVQYPSRTFKKELVGNYAVLGKALVHDVPERLARALFKEEKLRTCIFKEMQRYLKSEMKCVCSRKYPSMLRVKTKEELVNFDFKKLCLEWKKKAPLFYTFLKTIASPNNTAVEWLPSMAVAGSILLKQRNSHMSACATIIGILLKSRSLEVRS